MISPRFSPERYFYAWGPHEPTLRVANGATIPVVCPDADNGMADGSPLPETRRQQSAGTALFAGNPLAGPIFVEGLTPDDCLAVDLETIELDRAYGLTLLAPAHGALSRDQLLGANAAASQEVAPRHLYRWKLEHVRGLAVIENPLGDQVLSVPLRPMVGSIGVCPHWGQTFSSLFAGDYGGNLDLPIIKAGARALLPVNCAGGGLLLGDIHAAQGAGEVVGGGIETSGVATITVSRLPGRKIVGPRICVDQKIFAVATDGDLRTALTTAYARLLDWLVVDLKLSRWDGYQLISQTAEVEIGGISIPSNCTVAAGIALAALPSACLQELQAWLPSVGL